MEVLSDGGGEGSRLASYTKEIISGKSKQTVVSKLKKQIIKKLLSSYSKTRLSETLSMFNKRVTYMMSQLTFTRKSSYYVPAASTHTKLA